MAVASSMAKSVSSAMEKAKDSLSSKKLGTTKLSGSMPESESRIRGLKQKVLSSRENKMSSSAARTGSAMAQAVAAWRNRLRRG